MTLLRVSGLDPNEFTDEDRPAAVQALMKAGKLPKAVAEGLLKGLVAYDLWAIEFTSSSPATAKRKVAQLRRAHVLANVIETAAVVEGDEPTPAPVEPDGVWQAWVDLTW